MGTQTTACKNGNHDDCPGFTSRKGRPCYCKTCAHQPVAESERERIRRSPRVIKTPTR